MLKINFDSSTFEASSCSGIAIITRDCNGRFIMGFNQKIKGLLKVDHLEAMAAAKAVKLAAKLVYDKVVLEGLNSLFRGLGKLEMRQLIA